MSIEERVRKTFDGDYGGWLEFDDRLELVGIAAGLFVALVGLGTLVGMPWTHQPSTTVAVGRIAGAVGTVAVGLGIVWLATR